MSESGLKYCNRLGCYVCAHLEQLKQLFQPPAKKEPRCGMCGCKYYGSCWRYEKASCGCYGDGESKWWCPSHCQSTPPTAEPIDLRPGAPYQFRGEKPPEQRKCWCTPERYQCRPCMDKPPLPREVEEKIRDIYFFFLSADTHTGRAQEHLLKELRELCEMVRVSI